MIRELIGCVHLRHPCFFKHIQRIVARNRSEAKERIEWLLFYIEEKMTSTSNITRAVRIANADMFHHATYTQDSPVFGMVLMYQNTKRYWVMEEFG